MQRSYSSPVAFKTLLASWLAFAALSPALSAGVFKRACCIPPDHECFGYYPTHWRITPPAGPITNSLAAPQKGPMPIPEEEPPAAPVKPPAPQKVPASSDVTGVQLLQPSTADPVSRKAPWE